MWPVRIAFAWIVTVGGCGQKVEMKELPSTVATVHETDQAKVKEYLQKNGTPGEVTAITDSGDHWLVEVQPAQKQSEPGKRALPTPPTSYRVNKQTGAVSSGFQ
jgi:hypothetical protein